MEGLDTRLDRLESQGQEAALRELANRVGPTLHWSPERTLRELRQIAGRLRDLERAYPAPEVDGFVDIEPNLRRLAMSLGLSPDEAVAEARLILENQGE